MGRTKACHYHTGTIATHQLDRGHRGEPVPLCEFCAVELESTGLPADAVRLISRLP